MFKSIKAYFGKQLQKWFNPASFGNNTWLSWGGVFSWGGTYNGIVAYDNKIVYSGLNLLVRKYIETDMVVSRTKNQNALKKYYKSATSNEMRFMAKALAIEELQAHPLMDLLEKPNSFQTGLELMEQFWFNALYGDGYIIAVNDDPNSPGPESRNYRPNALFAPNKNMVIPQKSNDRYRPIAFYRVIMFNGDELTLPPEQVFHLQKWNPEYMQVYGYNFAAPAGKTIAKNEQNQTAQGSAFINGGRGTLFSSDSEYNAAGQLIDKMSGEQMSLLKETMMRDMAGAQNNRKMNFTNGYVNAQNYGDTLAEMDLINAEKADWKDIYAVLGIPQVLAPTNESSTDATNAAIGYKSLVTNTIIPDLMKFDMKFKQWIAPWYGSDIIAPHDLTDFSELAPDLKLMAEVFGQPPLSNDEKRSIFKYDKMNDATQGETVLVSGNQKTLEQIMDGNYDPATVPTGKQYDYN